ncbi:MAG: lytic murein transglycosylase [Pseudomonadota bacterium]
MTSNVTAKRTGSRSLLACALSAAVLFCGPSFELADARAQTNGDAEEVYTGPSFDEWLDAFKTEATSKGILQRVVDEHLAGISIDESVYERNANQPEFAKAIWQYLDTAVSNTRLSNGQNNLSANVTRLASIEDKYGVDAEIIAAIWGLESAYGKIMGDNDVIQALATLAWRGRRTRYGRSQLIGALRILQNGYATRDDLKGSWAGAMGQTQFIPTTYLENAVDANGDGRRDIWNNLDDVFSSTANYLAKSGYEKDRSWGVEVTLPDGFDYDSWGPNVFRPLAEWASMGVTAARGDLLSEYDLNSRPRLLIPAGAQGPAFLVFRNFDVILKYNRSTAYALAVGLLADGLSGKPSTPAQNWPRGDRALRLSERKALQTALTDAGYDTGPADGIIGRNTQNALRAWQRANGQPADGYASVATLRALDPDAIVSSN